VFNGETSDSFHNFGFSQFCTFFHSEKIFTEYADKMNCYLYGPTFFKKVLQGTEHKDKVYQIFRRMNAGVNFKDSWPSPAAKLQSYFLPLFYGGPRIPFADTVTNPLFQKGTNAKVSGYLFNEYCPALGKTFTPENMYAWISQLYHSMHSQGSTVNLIKHC